MEYADFCQHDRRKICRFRSKSWRFLATNLPFLNESHSQIERVMRFLASSEARFQRRLERRTERSMEVHFKLPFWAWIQRKVRLWLQSARNTKLLKLPRSGCVRSGHAGPRAAVRLARSFTRCQEIATCRDRRGSMRDHSNRHGGGESRVWHARGPSPLWWLRATAEPVASDRARGYTRVGSITHATADMARLAAIAAPNVGWCGAHAAAFVEGL